MIGLPWREPGSSLTPAAPGWPGPRRGGPGGQHPAGSGFPPRAPGPAGGGSGAGGRPGAETVPGRPALALPPDRMPWRQGSRPLKRWTYVGVFGPELMLCAGSAAVGPLGQAFWAVWDRLSGVIETETRLALTSAVRVSARSVAVRSGPSRLELALTATGPPVEVVSPHGRSYIWTRKTPVRADGHFASGMEVRPVSASGLLDESAGYHARRTEWEWSAGVGTTVDGWPVTWNLVRGVHDAEVSSERTLWVRDRAVEAPPVTFSADLDEVIGADGSLLRFAEEAGRSERRHLGLVSSEYRQPFGRFSGTLPGGVELSDSEPALGVMERHTARW